MDAKIYQQNPTKPSNGCITQDSSPKTKSLNLAGCSWDPSSSSWERRKEQQWTTTTTGKHALLALQTWRFFFFGGRGGLGSVVVVVVVVVGILFGMVFIRTFFFWILVVVSPVEKGKEGMLLCDPCCSNPECRFSWSWKFFVNFFLVVKNQVKELQKYFLGLYS